MPTWSECLECACDACGSDSLVFTTQLVLQFTNASVVYRYSSEFFWEVGV